MFQSLRSMHVLPAMLLLFYQLAGVAHPLPVNAAVLKQTVVEPGYVYDDFQHVNIKASTDTDDDPYWWVINNGEGDQVYAECADASCITRESELGLKYARLQLLHDTTPTVWDDSVYNGTEISEYRTMHSSELPGRWLPTNGHPVTVSARVRFSSNYEQDGSGGAVGSAGLWLWNSYPDEPAYAPVNAFGFNWAEEGAAGGIEGLQFTVFQDTAPVYSASIASSVDMSAWHVWKFEWSVDGGGEQSIEWWLDGVSVDQTDLEEPFDALSLTFWNDNQFPTILENNGFTVIFHNPTSAQNFDIDWVEIEQEQ